ncbi:alcohol oxidase [Aspergillus steynii IBT 23096]|uniref:glucose oxidase n=1 Tax=Aspergillus steynii IBT 23096 TaxID=1392250 RepID=A0A2I2G4E9_9EURO|nr:alcohol oxidase [Aspergillus steynii IBT 23096]PLB47760.1 alcohol oxidase [Aspergillus steynii IBT 23096]
MKVSLLGLALIASEALADSRTPKIIPGVTADPAKVANRTYDYIIAGGGLTGLTIANKILTNTKATVLVIESGFYGSEYGPKIDDLNTYGQIFGSSVDHAYETSPQHEGRGNIIGLDKDVKIVRAGNGLGGSTLINGGTWTRPQREQLDSWSQVFGNRDWTWDSLKPYMDGIEKPRNPAGIWPKELYSYDPKCHNSGTTGNVEVGPRYGGEEKPWSKLIGALMNTVSATYPWVKNRKDLCCGDPRGVSMFLNTLDAGQNRMDAARSWLDPVLADPNYSKRITVLTGQLVGKVHLNESDPNNPSETHHATGVEFGVHQKELWKWDVNANKEVILAAGSAISPLILQWSGIGPEEWLADANITQKVDLPVGYNLQDQTTTTVIHNTIEEGKGQGQAAYFATFDEVFGAEAPLYKGLLDESGKLEEWAMKTIEGGGFFKNQTVLLKQYENYRDWLRHKNTSYAELFFDTGELMHFDLWNLIPFTRGYVKALDRDPYLRSFEYNPRFFENELDLAGQAAATRLARQLSQTHAMKPYAGIEKVPGKRLVPEGADLKAWETYVMQSYRANYHGVGTCSMMSRELGGVVNQQAKVYDVGGLRVVDGSIPPTQVSSHVMTVFYAMAAKIADDITGINSNMH